MRTNENADDLLFALALCVLLLLTPWPIAMMMVSAAGIFAWLTFCRDGRHKTALMVLVISFAVGAVIAATLSLIRGA